MPEDQEFDTRKKDQGPTMLSMRQTAVAVGVLFLTATATFLTADTLITSVLGNPDALVDPSAYGNVLKAAALLAFVDALAVVGIAVLLYPLLKRYSEPLALGYVGFRVAELAAVVLYLTVPLVLVALGEAGSGDTLDVSASQHFGSLLEAQYEVTLMVVFLLTSVSGVIFAFLLYRSRLVPRLLAILGLIGYFVLLVGTVLYMFRLIDLFQGAGTLVAGPVGLFELILPIWLIAKGFTHDPDRTGQT
jgi:hypothetical protein